MSAVTAKAKALGVIFVNKFGVKVYSKFYTKHSHIDFSKSEYDIRTNAGQQKLQSGIYKKIRKMNVVNQMQDNPQRTQIFSFSGFSVLFKLVHELFVFVLCEEDENYVLMEQVINCIGNTMLLLTDEKYVQKTIEDNLDGIVITVDEVLDQGVIMCLEETTVFNRVKMREGSAKIDSPSKKNSAQQESSNPSTGGFSSLFGMAKNSLQKTLNLG